ncbi:unnamed protein product [Caenorhabditis sp. 36 PRJEB53466]|nr:unnamed protein product [Caenorhabditis sp. 36 PRJEB53466]
MFPASSNELGTESASGHDGNNTTVGDAKDLSSAERITRLKAAFSMNGHGLHKDSERASPDANDTAENVSELLKAENNGNGNSDEPHGDKVQNGDTKNAEKRTNGHADDQNGMPVEAHNSPATTPPSSGIAGQDLSSIADENGTQQTQFTSPSESLEQLDNDENIQIASAVGIGQSESNSSVSGPSPSSSDLVGFAGVPVEEAHHPNQENNNNEHADGNVDTENQNRPPPHNEFQENDSPFGFALPSYEPGLPVGAAMEREEPIGQAENPDQPGPAPAPLQERGRASRRPLRMLAPITLRIPDDDEMDPAPPPQVESPVLGRMSPDMACNDDQPGPSTSSSSSSSSYYPRNQSSPPISASRSLNLRGTRSGAPSPRRNAPRERSPPIQNESEPTPLDPEFVKTLLAIANISRYEAGLDSAPTEEEYVPEGAELNDPCLAASIQLAQKLEEAERRQLELQNAGQLRHRRPQVQNVPIEGCSSSSSSSNADNYPIEQHDGDLEEEAYQLYRRCLRHNNGSHVPKIGTIEGLHISEYIIGYRAVLDGHDFPAFVDEDAEEDLDGIPVPPGSPGPHDGNEQNGTNTTTTTTVYRVVQQGSREILVSESSSSTTVNNSESTPLQKLFDTTMRVPTQPLFNVIGEPTEAVHPQELEGEEHEQEQQAEEGHVENSGEPAEKNAAKSTTFKYVKFKASAEYMEELERDMKEIAEQEAQLTEEERKKKNELLDELRREALIDKWRRQLKPKKVAEEEEIQEDANDGIFAVPTDPRFAGGFGNFEVSPAAKRLKTQPAIFSQYYVDRPTTSQPQDQQNDFQNSQKRCVPFSQDLMKQFPFLERANDEDSVFQMIIYEDPDVQRKREAMEQEREKKRKEEPAAEIVTEEVASDWPLIHWYDPDEMPPIENIPDIELAKIPPAFVNEMINARIEAEYRRSNPEPQKPKHTVTYEAIMDTEKEQHEKEFMRLVRSYIPSPTKVPEEIMSTKFEAYIRFPFFERPEFVDQVLTALLVPKGNSRVIPNMPQRIKKMSLGEFFKLGAQIWLGFDEINERVLEPITRLEQDKSIERFKDAVMRRLYKSTASPRGNGNLVDTLVDEHIEQLNQQHVTAEDIMEMKVYKQKLELSQQKLHEEQSLRTTGSADFVGPPEKRARFNAEPVDVVVDEDTENVPIVHESADQPEDDLVGENSSDDTDENGEDCGDDDNEEESEQRSDSGSPGSDPSE